MENAHLKKYYSVHGLITFSIEGNAKAVEHLCRQCEYFISSTPIDNVDIEIHIGAFKSIVDKKGKYSIVNRKYYVGDNIVFAEDMYKTARWRLQIENLDAEQTKFYFDGNDWTKYILHKSFVEVLLRYKLNQKGYLMVHSSSIAIDGKGVVFPASPEAGKTSTMLNYLELGQDFMSDDFSLVGKGCVYAYPTPITLHSHNLKRHPFLDKALDKKDKEQIFLRTLVLKATLGMGDISYKVDIWNKLKDVKVADSAPLAQMILLTKSSGSKVKVKKITRQRLAERLMIVNYYETVLFDGYLKAYYYSNLVDEKTDFWKQMKLNINNILNEDNYYELRLPQVYSSREFGDVADIIKNITGGGYKSELLYVSSIFREGEWAA